MRRENILPPHYHYFLEDNRMRAIIKDKEFTCTYKNGKLITLEECQECKKSNNCDIYALVLDDTDDE